MCFNHITWYDDSVLIQHGDSVLINCLDMMSLTAHPSY